MHPRAEGKGARGGGVFAVGSVHFRMAAVRWLRETNLEEEGRETEEVGHQCRQEPGAQGVGGRGHPVFISSGLWGGNYHAYLGPQAVVL